MSLLFPPTLYLNSVDHMLYMFPSYKENSIMGGKGLQKLDISRAWLMAP